MIASMRQLCQERDGLHQSISCEHVRSSVTKSVKVSVIVSKIGRTHLIFVDPEVEINGAYYREVLVTQMLLSVMHIRSVVSSLFPRNTMLLLTERRDNQPSKTTDTCIHFTRSLGFDPQQPRSESGRLLNGAETQQQVYRRKVHDVDELKQRLVDVWHGFKQSVNDDANREWRKRLLECICVKIRRLILSFNLTTADAYANFYRLIL